MNRALATPQDVRTGSVQGMTGFARATAAPGGLSLAWELRSVNGKGLDVRARVPAGFERLEPALRQAAARRFSRGNIQATLTAAREGASLVQPVVNQELLQDLAELAQRLQERFGAAPARADGLLALRGVLELPDGGVETEDTRRAADEAALALFDEALAELARARMAEGEALTAVLRGHLGAIGEIAARVEADPSREPAAVRERLAAQVRLLLDGGVGLDENRLTMEAALLAARADIREEVDRLTMHVASAEALLAEGGAIGRRLDVIAQEFNREANTLCSKSNAASVTAAGLELKAVVDQFREQVQNLE